MKMTLLILCILIVIAATFALVRGKVRANENQVGEEGQESPLPPYSDSEIQEMILERVDGGFDSRDQIVKELLEEENLTSEIKEKIPEIVDTALAQHKEKQKSWIGKTDCDRLNAAFSILEKNGIVARQNFTDCQTCGNDEIWDEIEKKEKIGEIPVIGYTYYHMQDTQSAVQDGGICLSYGAVAGDGTGNGKEKEDIAIGKRVVQTLEKEGLKVDWNGKLEARIAVKMDWKRRR